MLTGYRPLLLGCVSLALVTGCGFSSNSSTQGAASAVTETSPAAGAGTANIGYNAPGTRPGSDDLVVATPSAATVSVVIGARRSVSITFSSSDGRPMSGFGVSGTLGSLPAGWSGPASFSCAAVSTGSGCVLNLVYAPAGVDQGTLTVDYVVVDDSDMPRTDGSMTIAYAATPQNNVIAAASPSGQIDAVVGGGEQSVSVNFVTDDGNAATDLVVTTNLIALPPGWTSPSTSLTCAIVSTGNGCQLGLLRAPVAGAGGTFTLNYAYTDDSGAAKTGALDIPYFTPSANDVLATASPAGQIIAVQKTGGQVVSINFTTDDGRPAKRLYVTSDLTSLPAGWRSASDSFSCAGVSTGNGCQLSLTYAPAALTNGTLTLTYAYTDGNGTLKSGTLNLAYAATTNDNVVGTASPAGQVNAVVGMGTQAVTVSFTTDDARPATALRLTSSLTALPAGWSSPVGSLSCSGLNVDNACRLPLTYAPTAAGAGMLPLGYTYKNNAGETKTGTVSVAYRATTDDQIVGAPNPPSLAVRTGSRTAVTVTFATDDGNAASALAVDATLGALPAGWSSASNSFRCSSVSAGTACVLPLTYPPTVAAAGTLNLGFTYANDSGFLKTGTAAIAYRATTPYLYAANDGSTTLSACALDVDNHLTPCTTTGSGFDAPDGIALAGSSLYVVDTQGNAVSRCTLDAGGGVAACALVGGPFTAPTDVAVNASGTFAYIQQSAGLTVCAISAGDGSLSSCGPAGGAFDLMSGITPSADGSHAYGVGPTQVVESCTVASGGTLSGCVPVAASTPQAAATLAIRNGNLYVSTSNGSLYVCPINLDSTISVCRTTAAGTYAKGIAFIGNAAFLSTGSTTLWACAVNADGSLGACATQSDLSFDGTAGLLIR